jgi:bifunctional pyridoxal-dependent enzyme with beta-cystathionase and maltose regulon repressor activities
MAAEANLSLLRRHAAVILARQAAQRAVKRHIRSQGRVKLSTVSHATLTRLGNEWLDAHRELLAEAAQHASELGCGQRPVSRRRTKAG